MTTITARAVNPHCTPAERITRQAAALTRNAGERTTFLARADTELALVPLQDNGLGRSGPDIEFTQ
jgi:hypothetical protein